MGKYLKKFETQAAYTEAQSSLILPNVSFITENNKVAYNPYVDPYAGHEYVDFGLPSGTKWATMNVGASSETDYGNYYQYGKGAAQYAATSGDSNYSGTENPLDFSVDTAVQVWGGQWHTPTRTQFNELINNTDFEWVTINGVKGGKFISKTDSSKYIFLPESGRYENGAIICAGVYCNCWTSFNAGSTESALFMSFSDNLQYPATFGARREFGLSVRPVINV